MSPGNYFGVIINVMAISLGGLTGFMLGKRFPQKIEKTVMSTLGLIVTIIGLQMALETQNVLIMTLSLILGGLLGELLNIENNLLSWGKAVEGKFKNQKGNLANAFVFATLLYGIGAMAIMGSLESGLTGKHSILLTKALLDGVTAIAFSATMGIGISFSAIPILVYQGALVFLAQNVAPYLTAAVINELTAVGGVLIIAIGLNILRLIELPIANLLPAIPLNILFILLVS